MESVQKNTTEAFKQLIATEYDQLPRNQKAVADYLIKHLQEAAFLSVVEIGERSGVSKATVVRFAQRLGFDGFMPFRSALQQAVRQAYANTDRFQLIDEAGGESVYKVARQDVSNINKTIENLNIVAFNQIADLLASSSTIYTYGLGVSSLVSQIMSYSLNQVANRAFSVQDGQLSFEEQLMYMTPEDALVCLSFPPYSKRTIEAAEMARKKGVKVVGITDLQTAPVTEHCNHYICVESENLLFTNSIAALSVTVNALITEIALRNREDALHYIREVNDLMQKSGHFR